MARGVSARTKRIARLPSAWRPILRRPRSRLQEPGAGCWVVGDERLALRWLGTAPAGWGWLTSFVARPPQPALEQRSKFLK